MAISTTLVKGFSPELNAKHFSRSRKHAQKVCLAVIECSYLYPESSLIVSLVGAAYELNAVKTNFGEGGRPSSHCIHP